MLIERIVPAVAAAEESFDDPPDVFLFPEEEAVLRRSVGKRRREFTTARMCARAALGRLGLPPAPIVPGDRGAPTWPVGVVGSMTHCAGYRAAVVARADELVSVGIDAEPHDVLPEGVRDMVASTAEQAALDRLAAEAPGVHWDRLLFSAKESVYKAWFPLTGKWLDFAGAAITFDPRGHFSARLLVPGPVVGGQPLPGFDGRWLVADGLVVTSVAVLPPRAAPDGPA
jgi:4'-phosphopantetheinyl transferase EntD